MLKPIGKNSYVNSSKVLSTYVAEKDGKYSVCFRMPAGEVVWSEKFDTQELALAFMYKIVDGE